MLRNREQALPDCRPLLADPDDLMLVFQPIVDLAEARVAGYEALSRFPGTATPDVWFAAADDAGLGAELEALALGKALARVPDLPPGTFLSVNVSPHLLGSRPVQDALATRPDLRRVALELTAHAPAGDLDVLGRRTAELRERGALIALDGSGSGLRQMAALRPQIVKLDRAPVADADPAGIALAEAVAEFAGRIDARLLAEGVETPGELAAVARLGVPLAQGWLLGRPAPDFAALAPEVHAVIRSHAARTRPTDSVASLIRPVRQAAADGEAPGVPPAVLVGPLGEPQQLLLACPRSGEVYTAPVSLRVHASADITETLQRALTRPPAHRFEPVVCTDATGTAVGLVRIEDLASAAHSR